MGIGHLLFVACAADSWCGVIIGLAKDRLFDLGQIDWGNLTT
jgi:hypothetical protein